MEKIIKLIKMNGDITCGGKKYFFRRESKNFS